MPGQRQRAVRPEAQGGEKITDAELVAQTLAGSEDAFRRLVQRYQRPVFSLVLRMVRDAELAEDISQEAFVKAYRALDRFDSSRKFSSWLFKIAHNATIDQLRRSSLDVEPLETAEEGRSMVDVLEDGSVRSPEDLAKSTAIGAALAQAVSQLRPEYRSVMVLRFVEGLAYQEIAEVTGMALGTVKTNIHRARKELAEILKELGWEP